MIEEMVAHKGSHEIPGIAFLPAGKALGVTAWGMNVLVLAPNVNGYPEHDHVGDGQEEVYVLLKGTAMLRAGGHEWRMEPGMLVRVGPGEKRKLVPGDMGATVLALGATPGKAHSVRK